MRRRTQLWQALSLLTLAIFGIANAYGQTTYPWQEPNATVLPSGDLQWAPQDFQYEAGATVRYIDYENGDDSNDGASTSTPWKHHPWDVRASGNAAACSGIVTYVFKRGVQYRSIKTQADGFSNPHLFADESGLPGDPIRITSDPNWGTGEAEFVGSLVIPNNWQQATASDVPAGMDPTNVWYIDADAFYPKDPRWGGGQDLKPETVLLYKVVNGETENLHIARTPNWQEPGANFASDYWHEWDKRGKFPKIDSNGDTIYEDDGITVKMATLCQDTSWLKGFPPDYFVGGYVWSHYSSFMGTPSRRLIEPEMYNPYEGAIQAPHYGQAPGTRYFIEDLPQLLDTVGEFYLDHDYSETTGRRLFLRVAPGEDPNTMQIELSCNFTSIQIEDQSHIHVSGLKFTRTGWAGAPVSVSGNVKDVVIKNCVFDHLGSSGIVFSCNKEGDVMDSIVIADNDMNMVNTIAIRIEGESRYYDEKDWYLKGELRHVDILRNRIRETGLRSNDGPYSNVPSVAVLFAKTANVSGNVINRSFGSGLVVFGGKEGALDWGGYDIPLTRLFVHHNKVEHAALGVNDYGGLALWQTGPIFSYNNISGNAVGHWPDGPFGTGTTNLSYPLYLDGAFKIYNFNNILWGRKDDGSDIYQSVKPAYFNVFGFLNHMVNNTIVGTGEGFGGTSGNRNDHLGNLLVDITHKYIDSNHGGNPSLIGGGDDGQSGIDGASTLAYANNLFHGDAVAGTLVSIARGAEADISADDIATMAMQMQDYPLREGSLGASTGNTPITTPIPSGVSPSASDADFRPTENSLAINNGINYFIPFSLYATVGEWHFNQNHSDPEQILDYHMYPTAEMFQRSRYYKLPTNELTVDTANVNNYTLSPSEDWTYGALTFDGSRYATCTHVKMEADITLLANDCFDGSLTKMAPPPWTFPEPELGYKDDGVTPIFGETQLCTFPGSERTNLDMDTCNLLVEATLRIDELTGTSVIANKYDGTTGYQLYITSSGLPAFKVAASGSEYVVNATDQIDDGSWHHVLAEMDRATGRMTIYVDGALSGETTAALSSSESLENTADFVVAKSSAVDQDYLVGAIDFMRVCQGTLENALTDIDELYEWQTNGPIKKDFTGQAPMGRRDVGALEVGNKDTKFPEVLVAWDFEGSTDTTQWKATYYSDAISDVGQSGMIEMASGISPKGWACGDCFTFINCNEATLTDAIANDDYYEFTFVPNAEEVVDLQNIVMNIMSQDGDPDRHLVLFSNQLPYTPGNELAEFSLVKGDTKVIPLTGFTDLTEGDTITFRVYHYGSADGTGDNKTVGIMNKSGYDLSVVGVVKDLMKVQVEDNFYMAQVAAYEDDPNYVEYNVSDNKLGLQVEGNGYQKLDLEVTITSNTMLEFDFSSTDQGSIQGILFETDNERTAADANNAVQVYGTEDWAKRSGFEYSGTGTQSFSIPIGQYFTGDFTSIVFLAKDADGQDQKAAFANMKLYEGAPQQSVTIAAWDFDGEGKDIVSSVADTYDAGLITTAPSLVISQGSGLNPKSYAWPDGFTGSGQDKLTLTEAIAADDYQTFTLTPGVSNAITVTQLNMHWFCQGSDNRQFAIMTNQQPWAAGNEIATGTLTRNDSYTEHTISGLNDITEALEFRIYYFGDNNRFEIVGSGHATGNDFEVLGYVTGPKRAQDITEFDQTSVNVYPNPANGDVLNVDLGEVSQRADVFLFDMQGKLHIAQSYGAENLIQLDISNLNNGMYILKVKTDKGFSVTKISVQ